MAISEGNISITYFHKTRKLKNAICADTAKSISTVYLWSRTTRWFVICVGTHTHTHSYTQGFIQGFGCARCGNGLKVLCKALVFACGAWVCGTQSWLSAREIDGEVVESKKLTEAHVSSCGLWPWWDEYPSEVFTVLNTNVWLRTRQKVGHLQSPPLPGSWPKTWSLLAGSSHGLRGKRALWGVYYKGTNPVHKDQSNHPDLITSQTSHLLIPSQWG